MGVRKEGRQEGRKVGRPAGWSRVVRQALVARDLHLLAIPSLHSLSHTAAAFFRPPSLTPLLASLGGTLGSPGEGGGRAIKGSTGAQCYPHRCHPF